MSNSLRYVPSSFICLMTFDLIDLAVTGFAKN
nr:MAG TPA: hypothetical protein [Caudoviricetes sp.]